MGISIAGLAAAGAANNLNEYNNKFIDQNLAIQRAQALADIGRTSNVMQAQQIFDQNHRNAPTALADQLAAQKASALQAGDTAAQVTEDNANDPDLRTANASIAQAAAANTPQKLTPGEQVSMGGKTIAENTNLTPQQVQLEVYRAGLKGNLGKPGPQTKADHFDEKEWATAFGKIDATIAQFQDPLGGKQDSSDLRVIGRQTFNQLRASGDYDPEEARAVAEEAMLKVKNQAIKLTQAANSKGFADGDTQGLSKPQLDIIAQLKGNDPKRQISEVDVVRALNARFAATAAAAAKPGGGGAAPAVPTTAVPDAQGTPLQSSASIMGSATRQPGTPANVLAGMPYQQLYNMANGGYASPADKQAAAAELARRAQFSPQEASAGGPSLYGQ